MDTSINIIIRGVAICYKKDNVWKVLFPFDDCHSIKLSYKVDGAREVFLGHFGSLQNRISIRTDKNPVPAPRQSAEFLRDIIDLTEDGKTHPMIRQKGGWNDRGILLTIENANLDVKEGLRRDFPDKVNNLDIFLTDGTTKIEFAPTKEIGHSVEGDILLEENQRARLNVGETNILTTEPGRFYEITFDNDCDKPVKAPRVNDMEMLYELIEQPDNVTRKFVVLGEKKDTSFKAARVSIPPNLLEGKPCLVVRASKSEQLP